MQPQRLARMDQDEHWRRPTIRLIRHHENILEFDQTKQDLPIGRCEHVLSVGRSTRRQTRFHNREEEQGQVELGKGVLG